MTAAPSWARVMPPSNAATKADTSMTRSPDEGPAGEATPVACRQSSASLRCALSCRCPGTVSRPLSSAFGASPAMATQVTLAEAEVRAFSSLLSRVSETAGTSNRPTRTSGTPKSYRPRPRISSADWSQ
jgi:hypothetical protein